MPPPALPQVPLHVLVTPQKTEGLPRLSKGWALLLLFFNLNNFSVTVLTYGVILVSGARRGEQTLIARTKRSPRRWPSERHARSPRYYRAHPRPHRAPSRPLRGCRFVLPEPLAVFTQPPNAPPPAAVGFYSVSVSLFLFRSFAYLGF